jgi:competence ComEA-like helix-hairpin-helix protein
MEPSKGWGVWALAAGLGVVVWRLWERETRRLGTAAPAPGKGRVSLNRASAADLQRLPGIGPVMAGRIIAARPFLTEDDLLRVEGIGEATFESLKPLTTL